MNNWFTVKVKTNQQQEDGSFKRISIHYLVNAVSFTDAEKTVYERMADHPKIAHFGINTASRAVFTDILFDDQESNDVLFYACKISHNSITDERAKPKKIIQRVLVQSKNIRGAYELLMQNMSSFDGFKIVAIDESPIEEILE